MSVKLFETPAMKPPRVRFTVRRMMAAVAVAGWISFNAHLLAGLENDLPPSNAGRILACRIAAFAVCPLVGGIAAWAVWRGLPEPISTWGQAVLRGVFAGVAAGGVAWFAITVLLCIGHGANGQTPLAAIIMGAEGAAIHAVVGALCSGLWWRYRAQPSKVGTGGRLSDILRSGDPPESSG